MKAEIRIPTTQYGYINLVVEQEEKDNQINFSEYVIDIHNRAVDLYKESLNTPENSPNLQPIPFLRLLHKYMVQNRLELEDIESLGTDKLYSQKDVVNLIKNVFAKIKRDADGGRINKEEDIRYN